MLDPIFSRRHRIVGAYDIPSTPTNQERVQAYRAIAPVQFWNSRFSFNPRRQSEAAASRGALAGGDFSTEAALLGVNVVERAPANNHEARRPASTPSPLKDEQPRRAASPIPGTYTHTPGA